MLSLNLKIINVSVTTPKKIIKTKSFHRVLCNLRFLGKVSFFGTFDVCLSFSVLKRKYSRLKAKFNDFTKLELGLKQS